MTEISDDARRNREAWTRANAEHAGAKANGSWAADEITWGTWGVPERETGTLGEVAGLDVVELVELYAPDGAGDHPSYDFVTAEWARRWPSEEIRVAEERR